MAPPLNAERSTCKGCLVLFWGPRSTPMVYGWRASRRLPCGARALAASGARQRLLCSPGAIGGQVVQPRLRGQPFLVGKGPAPRAKCRLVRLGCCVGKVVIVSVPSRMDVSWAPRARGAAFDCSRARMGCGCLPFVGSRKLPTAPRIGLRGLVEALGGALRPVERAHPHRRRLRVSVVREFAGRGRATVAIV